MQDLSRAMKIPCSLVVILLFPLVNAYTWEFTSPPTQCGNVTLSISGSGGQPPYNLLIIPNGPSPLPNDVEVRTIQNIPFSGTSMSFKLNYPENSSFVAVVSDQSGYGSGGASASVAVQKSSDSSCYSISKPTKIAWDFNFDPTGGLTQCESVRLWWDPTLVNGTVNFLGTIPGGTSFAVPPGSLSSVTGFGTGFNWTVDIAGGTNIILLGNDQGGIGIGGYSSVTIANTLDETCLNKNSPSSTAGSPAGGVYPTSTQSGNGSHPTQSSGNSSGNHSSSNIGPIIGGVLGGVALLVTAFWYLRRRPYPVVSQQRSVNLNVLEAPLDDEDGNGGDHDLPQHYRPQPFLPDSTSEPTLTVDRTLSMTQTPMTPTTTTRKSASFPQLPPATIIQHDDAGPSEPEPEIIELPPAYSNIRHPRRSPLASYAPTSAEDEYR